MSADVSRSWIVSLILALALAAAAVAQAPDDYEPGVDLRIYDIGTAMSKLPLLVTGQTPNLNERRSTIDWGDEDFGGLEDRFLVHVTGRLHVPQAGAYAFRLTSDDGSRLRLADIDVLDHDGLHGPDALETALELPAGYHELEIWHFENGGGAMLRLEWKIPGASEFVVIPESALSVRKGLVRVTSPGPKKVISADARLYAGDGTSLRGVHPSYDLMCVRPEGFEPKVGGMDFLSDGRLVVCCWSPEGDVYVLDGVHGDDPSAITAKRIATGLAEPLGLTVVDDRIFVLQKQELTELIDEVGDDDIIDFYRAVCSGWSVSSNFHEFAFGLVYRNGSFFFNLAVAIDPGGRSSNPQAHDRGRTIQVDAASGRFGYVTEGLRTPNGIGLGPDQSIWLTDNQGDWVPVSKLMVYEEGAFYGSRAALPEGWIEKPVTPPVVWLPQGQIGNSPGEPAAFPEGGPFAGQMAVCDVTHGGVKRVFVETVNGVRQGSVFRFTQGLEAGTNRIRFREDGTLFAGGIGSTGNWGQEGKGRFGLERLRPNGTTAFEMLAVRARSNGLEIELTEPLAEGLGWDPAHYRLTRYRYEPTASYGGPKIDTTRVKPRSVSVSEDRRRIFLELGSEDLRAGHVYELRLSLELRAEDDRVLWSTEAWYTMNEVPVDDPGVPRRAPKLVGPNALTAADRSEGWDLLFDGESVKRWRGFRKDEFPDKGWVVEDGALVHQKKGGGGDIITRDSFGDFEFRCEWRVEPGGNSGIMYRVTEELNAAWRTGPEMQVLDDLLHRDGRNPLTSAGSLYALVAAPRGVALPAEQWNHARVVARGTRIEHWLNGVRVVDLDLASDEAKALIAESKFAKMPRFAKNERGHIVLQDHSDRVEYRNLAVRRLD